MPKPSRRIASSIDAMRRPEPKKGELADLTTMAASPTSRPINAAMCLPLTEGWRSSSMSWASTAGQDGMFTPLTACSRLGSRRAGVLIVSFSVWTDSRRRT